MGTFYSVWIILSQDTAQVEKAFCICPAGVSGCYNHVTETLHCVEDYFHLGLNEDDEKGCAENLQTWNKPKPTKWMRVPLKLVTFTKKVYGVEKMPKVHVENKWDCFPMSRKENQPGR